MTKSWGKIYFFSHYLRLCVSAVGLAFRTQLRSIRSKISTTFTTKAVLPLFFLSRCSLSEFTSACNVGSLGMFLLSAKTSSCYHSRTSLLEQLDNMYCEVKSGNKNKTHLCAAGCRSPPGKLT